MRSSRSVPRVAACALAFAAIFSGAAFSAPADPGGDAELLRSDGDLSAQRRHVWRLIAQLTRSEDGQSMPGFERWYGENEVFARPARMHGPLGMRGFERRAVHARSGANVVDGGLQSGDAPVLTYTLYDAAAYRHIRDNELYRRTALERLRRSAATPAAGAQEPAVPPFPLDAMVIKTAWWPIAKDGMTALPVWDPRQNPARSGGNGYASWKRVVAIDPDRDARAGTTVSIEFLGRTFGNARRVRLDALHHLTVDARMAARVMRDLDSRKAVLIALGRPLVAGDYLALVGANLATRETREWVWAAIWWHDAADIGPFASGRPDSVRSLWRNYLMQVAFDAESPRAADGGSHVCFNPWFEARFPDGGQGGGLVSNCMACHRRASYPAVPFLPVTRGVLDVTRDAAYGPQQLRTSLLWSIALHAGP